MNIGLIGSISFEDAGQDKGITVSQVQQMIALSKDLSNLWY